MDDLDKQLAELQLINNTELPPNPTLQRPGTTGRKIAPVVPPKPKKPQPQIPHSCSVKQKEPSYTARLPTTTPSPTCQSYESPTSHSKTPSSTSTLPLGASVSQSNLYGNSYHYANIQPESNVQYSNLPNLRTQHGSLPRSSPIPAPVSVTPIPPMSSNLVPKGYNRKPDQHVTYSNVQVGNRNDGLIYSNLRRPPPENTVYSNLPHTNNLYSNAGADDLPPPPPPPVDTTGLADYGSCSMNISFPPPPEVLPPPPSPVSSSYSELRRATQPNQDYNSYGIGSQSSTYESIYEPINPRPPSQMSSRSNYSLYAPYVSGGSHMSGPSQSASRIGGAKEQEVDALTDLLVQGMENEPEGDCYGICVKCREKIVGENSGCTAMEQIYHTKCFTCHHCAINLEGKPFYALDGKPYCEEDYMNTLEKCCVCMKPILDRILRATGKPYHPQCFCCVICGKILDGIPFTVDATNQIHCIADFHKKFAPRCCVCKLPIMPEPGQEQTVRVVALDRSFHVQCYKCEDCGVVLTSEGKGKGCYPLDDHVLCKSCNAERVKALTSHMTTEL